MSGVPLAVRVALWATAAWSRGEPLGPAVQRAHAGLDELVGDLDHTLAAWRSAGERVLLVALPRPGSLAGMPPAAPEALGAAVDAGQCVLAPGAGGILVPEVDVFGPPGDRGWLARWTGYAASPLPAHVVEATDPREAGRLLTEAVREATAELTAAGGIPWHAAPPRSPVADPRLPPGLPPRALELLDRAVTVAGLAAAGLDAEDEGAAVDAGTSQRRRLALGELARAAAHALATAANAAALAQARSRTER